MKQHLKCIRSKSSKVKRSWMMIQEPLDEAVTNLRSTMSGTHLKASILMEAYKETVPILVKILIISAFPEDANYPPS